MIESSLLRRGKGLVEQVTFRIGGKRVAHTSAASYVRQRRLRSLRHLDGRIRARVVVRDGEVTRSRILTTDRPGCLG